MSVLYPGCERKVYVNDDVDKYIQQLIKGKYASPELPEFTTEYIPELLEYKDDTTLIHNFPHNPISSLWLEDCRLGVFVLWTIESIRAVEIQSEYLIGRFPSQNPLIYFTNSDIMMSYSPSKAHSIAAKAYYDWWYDDGILSVKLETDPLLNTGYSWH